MHIAVFTDHQLNTGQDSALPTNSVSVNNKCTAVQPSTANKSVDNEDDDGDVVAGPTVEAHVTLAKTPHKFQVVDCCYTT